MKEKIDKSTIIIRDSNTFLQELGINRKKISQDIEVLENSINQLNLIDIYRTPHSTNSRTHFQIHMAQ